MEAQSSPINGLRSARSVVCREASGPGVELGHQSYLVLLESDLPYLAVPHEGSRYAVHTLSRPDPNDEVWREKSDLLPYFPLKEMVGVINLTISGSKLNPCPTRVSDISLTRHHSSLESSMTVIFSPGLGEEGRGL